MKLSATIGNRNFTFSSLKEVFAKGNEEKSGDINAGIAAENVRERVAAKRVLSNISLSEIFENPIVPPDVDIVSKIIYNDIDKSIYDKIKHWSVGELREYILSEKTSGSEILEIGKGLTSEMIAAVCRLMGNLDLITSAAKIRTIVHANNTIGLRDRISVRLQPNHPYDDPEGILASMKEGLSFGMGDAIIGINPVIDDPDTVKRIMNTTWDFIREWDIPTQNCVLAHLSTQIKAIEKGGKADILFQSLAGTEKGLDAFGIDIKLLDDGYKIAKEKGTAQGPNVMYFETGQGAELSANAHLGCDQLTMESRCYGLARHYNPFLVNTVVGFIGPEYLKNGRQFIRAGLEDHFMGKLHGISMGCDVCYTNHMDADQNDLENLAVLLSVAGVNYFMGVPMGDDVMLNYQSSSFHDNASLRETLNLRPAPEFEAWLEKFGLMINGHLTERAGDLSIFA